MLVAAWLEAAAASRGLRAPAGYVLSGVRSGQLPAVAGGGERARAVERYQRLLASAGHLLPSEGELLDDAFGARGVLRRWSDDEGLRAQLLAYWRAVATSDIST